MNIFKFLEFLTCLDFGVHAMSFGDDVYALVVDDDETFADLTATQLEHFSDYVSAEYVTSGAEALEAIDNFEFHAVVSDHRMPGMDGIELLDEVADGYDMPFIVYTGNGSEELAVEAMRHGAEDYVINNSTDTFEVLANRVENAAVKHKVETEIGVLKSGIDDAGHAIQITDSEGRIIYVNEAMEDISGFNEDELIGEDPSILSSGEHSEDFYSDIWHTLEDGNVWRGEMLNTDSEGEDYWIDQTISPVKINGELRYMIAVNTDITDKKQMQERREMLNSMLRHDVGNDFQIITGTLGMLERTDLTDTQEQYVDTIRKGVDNSCELIKGIRELLEDDPHTVETESIEVDELIDSVVEENKSIARRNDVAIETQLLDNYAAEAGPLVDQALSNLVQNAIVHPEDVGRIDISVEASEDTVNISVADDGEGLPDDFSWEKGAKGKDSDGTGVGTWLAKEVVTTYEGSIEAGESDMGGAEFNISFERA